MKFKIRYTYLNHSCDETQLVSEIADADAVGGELERLHARVQTRTEVLDYIVSMMPPDQVRKLAVHFGYEEVRNES